MSGKGWTLGEWAVTSTRRRNAGARPGMIRHLHRPTSLPPRALNDPHSGGTPRQLSFLSSGVFVKCFTEDLKDDFFSPLHRNFFFVECKGDCGVSFFLILNLHPQMKKMVYLGPQSDSFQEEGQRHCQKLKFLWFLSDGVFLTPEDICFGCPRKEGWDQGHTIN